ncbi:oligosaccharide flippase family protein [Acinetobacter lwoffii]|uniref:oligosaccharide flippase family protein n=1 Tax=Acinetobacter lwoffii TaxID=28090 RepID=UPI0035BC6D3D|nr:hypothetical protein ABEDC_0083 [Acinetobacter lwoffii]
MKKIYDLVKALTLNILASFSAFVVTVFLGKTLTVADYGDFSTALFIILLISPLVGFGVPKFLLREFGREGLNAKRWLEPAFNFVRKSLILIILIILIISFIFINKNIVAYYVILLIPVLLNQVLIEFFSVRFQLERNYKKVALINALPNIIRLFLLVVVLLISEINIYNTIFIFSITSTLIFILNYKKIHSMRSGEIKYHSDYLKINQENRGIKTKNSEVVRESWPFGIMGVAYLIFFQINIVLINIICGSKLSGIYAAAFVFINMVYMFPSILYQKILLPKVHYLANHDYVKFKKLYKFGNLFMLIIGFISSVLVFLLADWAIEFFYGEKYIEAALVLKYLSLAIPFRFLSNSLGSILVTRDSMLVKVKIMSFMAVLNIVLGYIFILLYNIKGAVLVTVICEFLLMLFYYFQTRAYFVHGDKSL